MTDNNGAMPISGSTRIRNYIRDLARNPTVTESSYRIRLDRDDYVITAPAPHGNVVARVPVADAPEVIDLLILAEQHKE